jgi:hypothetical protein
MIQHAKRTFFLLTILIHHEKRQEPLKGLKRPDSWALSIPFNLYI